MDNFQIISEQYNLFGIFRAVFFSIAIYFILSRVVLPYIHKLNQRAATSNDLYIRTLGKQFVMSGNTHFMVSSLVRIPLYGILLLMLSSAAPQLHSLSKDLSTAALCQFNPKKCALRKAGQIEGKWYLFGEPAIACSLVGTWIGTQKNVHYSLTLHENGIYKIDNQVNNQGRWSLQDDHLLLKKYSSDYISSRSIISRNDDVFLLEEDNNSVTKFEWESSVKIEDCSGDKNRNTLHEQKIIALDAKLNNYQLQIADARYDFELLKRRYNENGRVKTVTSSSETIAANQAYLDRWQAQIERTGKAHYPQQTIGNQHEGDIIALIAINALGKVTHIQILHSNGDQELENAVFNIVHHAEPFEDFRPVMGNDIGQLEIIRTWKFTNQKAAAPLTPTGEKTGT